MHVNNIGDGLHPLGVNSDNRLEGICDFDWEAVDDHIDGEAPE